MENNKESKKKSENKKIIVKRKKLTIVLLFLLLGIGFYIYYVPFFAKDNSDLAPELREEVSLVLIGLDDEDSVAHKEVEADAIVVTDFQVEDKKITFKNISPSMKLGDRQLRKMKPQQIITELKEKIGLEAPYYFVLSYEGFKKTVNELGGVEISLDEQLEVPDMGLFLVKGENLLSGKEALNYSRWYDVREDELARIERQQKIINATADKIFQNKSLANIPELYRTLVKSYESTETNLDQKIILELIEFFRERKNIEFEFEYYEDKVEQTVDVRGCYGLYLF